MDELELHLGVPAAEHYFRDLKEATAQDDVEEILTRGSHLFSGQRHEEWHELLYHLGHAILDTAFGVNPDRAEHIHVLRDTLDEDGPIWTIFLHVKQPDQAWAAWTLWEDVMDWGNLPSKRQDLDVYIHNAARHARRRHALAKTTLLGWDVPDLRGP